MHLRKESEERSSLRFGNMSKIGNLPISIKEGINVTVNGNTVSVTGPKANFTYTLPLGINARVEEGKLLIAQDKKGDESTKALFGLTRANLANMVKGAGSGFEKKLELAGVGYRAQMQGADLSLSVGFSHPVKIKATPGISFVVAENIITVAGSDKALVGNVAAQIRAIRPPEPYKGKGIKYQGEYIRKKAGKAAKAVGGAK